MRLVASLNRVATTKLFGRRYSNGELIYDYGKAWVVMDRTVDDDERIKQRSGFFSVKAIQGQLSSVRMANLLVFYMGRTQRGI